MPQWTRKLTFPEDAQDDWTVLRDGYVVGRVFADRSQASRDERWRWAVITMPSASGWALDMHSALEQVRAHASDRWGHEPPKGWP